jgi:hypothetical protein
MKLSYRNTSEGGVHTGGEKLVKARVAGFNACVTAEEVARKIQFVPLSDNTVQRRIRDCAAKVLYESCAVRLN